MKHLFHPIFIISILFAVRTVTPASAQTESDRLWLVLRTHTQADTFRVNRLNDLTNVWGLIPTQYDSLARQALVLKIMDAIREVMNGGAAMTPSIALKVMESFRPNRDGLPIAASFMLTDKEKEVLQRLVEGDSYKLLAWHCGISMGTVRTHIVNIYEKLHVNSKSEAVAKALKTGLFK